MAVINPIGTWIARGVHQTTWTGITGSGDTMTAATLPQLPNKTVQVEGTFGGGTVTLIGGNNSTATNFSALNDNQGNPLSFTANKIEKIGECPLKIQPTASAMVGASVNVIIISSAWST